MKQKMMKKGIWYGGIGVAAVLAAVLIVVIYRRENQFQPIGSDRDLQVNQVVFSEDDASAYGGDRQQNSEDEIWKKDEEAQDQNRPDRNGQADYLFEENELARTGADSLLMPEENGTENVPFSDQGMEDLLHGNGSGYVLTADADQADWIISGPGVPGLSGGNTTGSSEGKDGSTSGNGGSANGNGGNAGETPGQGGGKPTASPSVTPEPSPSQRPSDRVPDPDYGKDEPSPDWGNNYNKKYSEDDVKQEAGGSIDSSMVVIRKASSSAFLYKGQKIDEKIVYCALDTFVKVKDPNSSGDIYYYWDMDDYNQYIRIDAVSFDAGSSWNSDFPVTIPEDLESKTIQIKASYRFSKNSTNWMQEDVEYQVEPNCIYVLAKKLPEENPVIRKEDILNSNDSLYFPMYLRDGQSMNLFNLQEKILDDYRASDNTLSYVFPGWMEGGEKADWFYTAESGRHILEPEDLVAVEDGYTVKLQNNVMWLTPAYDPTDYPYWDDGKLCSLQVLTDYNDTSEIRFERMRSWKRTQEKSKLTVPDYVQAVIIDKDRMHSVDYLEIPESVLYIDINAGLTVNEGYEVDPQNIKYKATEDGMLVNYWETEILSVPYNFTTLTVPSNIWKVTLAENNKIQTVELLADNEFDLPDMNYECLNEGSRIVVKEDALEAFMEQNYEAKFSDGKCLITMDRNSDITYKLINDLIIDSNGQLAGIATKELTEITLPEEVISIGGYTFEKHPEITRLILDEKNKVTLEKDCFSGSSIETILCYSQEQYEEISKQLEEVETGKTKDEDIVVICIDSRNGYVYEEKVEDGKTVVTLLRVPKDIESFDGTIPEADGTAITVTEIGDNAFAGCASLKWVVLPEQVTVIGYQAFKNCTALEGLLIDTKDTITIGNKSLDGCSALRFVASNAKHAIRVNDYDPVIKDQFSNSVFYVPTISDGYTWNEICFTAESGVTGYQIVKLGEKGRMLYGIGSAGEPWLALKAGTEADRVIKLPETTREIYSYAMMGTFSAGGSFTIENMGSLKGIEIDSGAFASSGLGDELVIEDSLGISNLAFQDCQYLNKVTLRNVKNVVSDAFSGCAGLKKLVIQGAKPVDLILLGSGVSFHFNSFWTEDEEAQIVQVKVEDSSKEDYMKQWRYTFAGYAGWAGQNAYQEMWNDIYFRIGWYAESLSEVDVEVEAKLLAAENRVRRLLGMDKVNEPTDYYPYHYNSLDKTVTLVGVPSDKEEIDFTNLVIEELPDDAKIDYIAADTFSGCQVKTVKFDENLKGIESGIFNGITGELTVEFTGTDPVELNNWTSDAPFTFGMDEDKLHIKVPAGTEQTYIDAWSCVLAGYENREVLQRSIATQLQEELQREPSDEEVELAVKKCLLPEENRLRKMMGLELLDESILSENLQKASDKKELETEDQEKEDPEIEETDPSLDEEENGDAKDPEDSKDSNDTDDPDNTGDLDSSKDTDDSSKPDDGKEPDSTKDPDNSKENEDYGNSENKDSQDSPENDTKVEDTVL